MDGLSHRDNQSPETGRKLIRTGWAIRIIGTGIGLAGYVILRVVAEALPIIASIITWLASVLALVGGMRIFTYGRLIVAKGKRHTAKVIRSFTGLIDARYVLYLRPFSHDKEMSSFAKLPWGGSAGGLTFFLPGLTQEESLVRRFGGIGRVIAISRPDEDLPLPGATRGYLPLDDWQDVVSGLIRGAHVAALAAGIGPGTVWEFTEAVRVLDLRRLILLVYCDSQTYDQFREAVRAEHDERRSPAAAMPPAQGQEAQPSLPELPDFPPLSRPRPTARWVILMYGGKKRANWDFPLKGIVTFDEQRQPTFLRFDPTAVRLRGPWSGRIVKHHFKLVLSHLTALPPNQENRAHSERVQADSAENTAS